MQNRIKQSVMAIALAVVLALGVAAPASAQIDISLFDSIGLPTDIDGSKGVLVTVVNVLLFLIGALSVIMIIYGGIRYVTSGGDQGAVTSAKNTILYAVVGLIIAILAYAVVNFVLTSFGVGGGGGEAPAGPEGP